MADKLKVLVVDDSALIRVLLRTILEKAPQIEVVATATDPYDARKKIKKYQPDVLTLDVEMPKMDGITFLKNLMRLHPMPVVMVSTLTEAGAEVTLEALRLGAFDFIAKPKSDVKNQLSDLADALIEKVLAAGQCNLTALEKTEQTTAQSPDLVGDKETMGKDVALIAIGASTGGTEAIHSIVTNLPTNLPPIVMTQHIPDVFSTSFARRLDRSAHLAVYEVREETRLRSGCAYLAPGHCHMVIEKKGSEYWARLDDCPPINRHKPSVDALFESVAGLDIAGQTMAFLLTGMGADGAKGLLSLKNAGAATFAQNEATSVVWGMPGAAVKLGAAQKQVALGDIPRIVTEMAALKMAN